MNVEIKVPGVGESITEGLLASWAVSDGTVVIEGQAIFELETDKTTIDVTAPATGTLSITVKEGTEVKINQVVGLIDTDKAPETEQKTPAKAPAVEKQGNRITPSALAEAARKDTDLDSVTGSGRKGMITKSDISDSNEKPAKSKVQTPPAAPGPATASPSAETRKPLSRIRKIIAANLARTRDELVLLTTFNEADMNAVKAMRVKFGEAFLKRHGIKLGFMSFFLKASASALAAYPEANAYIDGDEVVYRNGVHISVAVSTERGLVTPVVRNVESKSFAEIEKEIIGFAQKAKDKTLMPDDLMGGSFTVTNGGIFGSLLSTPLPAPKQSAILGMHSIQDRPVALNGEVVIRPMMYLAFSYDHRLIDGREAVGCLKSIKEALENPERLLLEV